MVTTIAIKTLSMLTLLMIGDVYVKVEVDSGVDVDDDTVGYIVDDVQSDVSHNENLSMTSTTTTWTFIEA